MPRSTAYQNRINPFYQRKTATKLSTDNLMIIGNYHLDQANSSFKSNDLHDAHQHCIEALKYYDYLCELDSKDGVSKCNLAFTHHSLAQICQVDGDRFFNAGQYNEASSVYHKAIEHTVISNKIISQEIQKYNQLLNAENFEIYNSKILAQYDELEQHQLQAQSYITKIDELTSDAKHMMLTSSKIFFRYGYTAFELKLYDEAKKSYDSAIKFYEIIITNHINAIYLNKELAKIYYYYGQVSLVQGEFENAEYVCRNAEKCLNSLYQHDPKIGTEEDFNNTYHFIQSMLYYVNQHTLNCTGVIIVDEQSTNQADTILVAKLSFIDLTLSEL